MEKQSELLHTQTSAEDQPKQDSGNTELLKREEIPGTPFKMITVHDTWFIAYGPYRLTPEQPVTQDTDVNYAKHYINQNLWDILINVIFSVTDFNHRYDETRTEIDEKIKNQIQNEALKDITAA